jgi:hypothetical protein
LPLDNYQDEENEPGVGWTATFNKNGIEPDMAEFRKLTSEGTIMSITGTKRSNPPEEDLSMNQKKYLMPVKCTKRKTGKKLIGDLVKISINELGLDKGHTHKLQYPKPETPENYFSMTAPNFHQLLEGKVSNLAKEV